MLSYQSLYMALGHNIRRCLRRFWPELYTSQRKYRQLEAENAALKQQLAEDPLTGLTSERGLWLAFVAEMSSLTTSLRPSNERRVRPIVTALAFDLDNFKLANDTRGHAYGDEVLRIIGKLMHAHLGRRPGDILAHIHIIARLHGDEFVAILPGASAKDATTLAEQFQEAVRRDQRLQFVEGQPGITVSIGIAREFLTANAVATEVLKRLREKADAALYEAKRAGRDKVVLHHEIT